MFGEDVDVFRPERWLLSNASERSEGASTTTEQSEDSERTEDKKTNGKTDGTNGTADGVRSEDQKERIANMRRTVDLIFGYGRWACAGKTLAFLELNKTLVEMMRRFELQLVYPLRPVSTINHNLFLQKNMWMQATERKRRAI